MSEFEETHRGLDTAAVDILVLAGAGTGHYHPIAGLLSRLDPSWRVAVSARVSDDHPLTAKVVDDGFEFIPWPTWQDGRPTDRLLRASRRWVMQVPVARLAARSDGRAPLPPLSARTAFAAASLMAPLARDAQGASIDELLRRTRPRLLLCEGNEDWVEALAGRHDVNWAYYTTGPVSTVLPGRPVGPTGFDPHLLGAAKAANEGLRMAKLLRRRAQRRTVRRSDLVDRDERRWREPVAKLALSVAELDAYPQLRPHDVEYAGFFPYRAHDGWSDDVAPASCTTRDTVLVTWGSGVEPDDHRVLAALAPTLERLSTTWRVVVVGEERESLDRVQLHPRVLRMRRSAAPPYRELRRARLTIGHGGYGTIKESVACGAPVLTVPAITADRMETAQRIVAARVGGVLDRAKIAAAPVEEVVDQLLADRRVADNVDRVGRALRDPRRKAATVERMEELLRSAR